MAKKNRLIGVRRTDTMLFLKLDSACECVDLVTPTLLVSKPNCTPDVHTWITDPCTGRKLYRVTCARQPKVLLTAATPTADCNGWIAFGLDTSFHSLGTGRLDAELKSITGSMCVQLQVFDTRLSIDCGYTSLPRSPQLPDAPPAPDTPGAFYEIPFEVVTAGAQEIPLYRIRAGGGLFQVFINGVLYSTSSDYQIVASSLILPASMGLQAGDDILVVFQ